MIFNRYWICDKSGIGREKWLYFTGDFGGDLEEARWHILDMYESWAHHAERYHIDIELNVEPTKEFVEEEFRRTCDMVVHYNKRFHELEAILKGMK